MIQKQYDLYPIMLVRIEKKIYVNVFLVGRQVKKEYDYEKLHYMCFIRISKNTKYGL